MEKLEVKGFRGDSVVGYFWGKVENPKAIVQIVHGMQEHAKRYDDFAKYLNSKGYIVFANDLRGHGETIKDVLKQGQSDTDIFEDIVNDEIIFSNMLKEKYQLPLYLLGHSFGSFIAQNYMTKCSLADKVVLSGSAYTKNASFQFGNIMAGLLGLFRGKTSTAKFIEKMSFGSYAKNFENGNWLSRDESVFEKYKNDEFCGYPFPYSFYKSFFKGALKNYKEINNINPKQRIFIISGAKDPVGSFGKLPTKLYEFYKKHNLDVEIKLYEEARHEVLNETNKKEVYKDVVDFFDKK